MNEGQVSGTRFRPSNAPIGALPVAVSQGVHEQLEGWRSKPTARVVQVIARKIGRGTGKHTFKPTITKMILDLIERKVGEPMAGQSGVANEINCVEYKRTIDAHACFAFPDCQAPSVQRPGTWQAEIDRSMLDEL